MHDLDDVLIGGVYQNDCCKRVVGVLTCFEKHGSCVDQYKYFVFVREVRYLSYLLSEKGLRPRPEKADATRKAVRPVNYVYSLARVYFFVSFDVEMYNLQPGSRRTPLRCS